MAVLLLMLWVLPLFHSTPRLGPVLNHFDHYQPFHFPLLLVIPALAIDIVFFKFENLKPFIKVTLAALSFLILFFIVQWFFGGFLETSPLARGRFFGSYSWYFRANPDWPYRYAFHPDRIDTGFALIRGMELAAIIAILTGWVGYVWGGWMRRVQR